MKADGRRREGWREAASERERKEEEEDEKEVTIYIIQTH